MMGATEDKKKKFICGSTPKQLSPIDLHVKNKIRFRNNKTSAGLEETNKKKPNELRESNR